MALLETLALLDSMLSNAPIGFAFFDRELRYVRVNEFLASTARPAYRPTSWTETDRRIPGLDWRD